MTEQIEQGTADWFAARCGRVTASRVADVIAKTKSGWGASRANYMSQLLCERLTGRVEESYTNAAMQHGIDTEPQARAAYEFFRDMTVQQVGFVNHPRIEMAGASPDGIIHGDVLGLVEIKCPNTATHLDTLLTGKIPAKYETQMQWQMACTAAHWCDFVSFDNRLPPEHSFFCDRIERDDKRIQELEEMVTEFLSELDAKIEQLKARKSA